MNELPPITFANGDRVPAHVRTAPSGVERVMFGENAEKPMARLSYVKIGEKACFAGMLFRDAPPSSNSSLLRRLRICQLLRLVLSQGQPQ